MRNPEAASLENLRESSANPEGFVEGRRSSVSRRDALSSAFSPAVTISRMQG
jgi:hypothetical protein